jgi:RimJ/RimL family protein N-acetyltransferase
VIATDGVVTLRPPGPDDTQRILAARDEEAIRWLGSGTPGPVACVWVDDELVGWVDYDRDADHDWLKPDEVNVGYCLFPGARGKGYASRAVELLLGHLQRDTEHRVATLLIDPENVRSLAVAGRLGFVRGADVQGECFFTRDLR